MDTAVLWIGLWLSAWALCELYVVSTDRASRTRTHALLERANMPQPVPRDGHVYDPASDHDAVLLSLSPAIRRDFQSLPPTEKEGLPGPSKYHHIVERASARSVVGRSPEAPSSSSTQ
jgi:hypothetical protein